MPVKFQPGDRVEVLPPRFGKPDGWVGLYWVVQAAGPFCGGAGPDYLLARTRGGDGDVWVNESRIRRKPRKVTRWQIGYRRDGHLVFSVRLYEHAHARRISSRACALAVTTRTWPARSASRCSAPAPPKTKAPALS